MDQFYFEIFVDRPIITLNLSIIDNVNLKIRTNNIDYI